MIAGGATSVDLVLVALRTTAVSATGAALLTLSHQRERNAAFAARKLDGEETSSAMEVCAVLLIGSLNGQQPKRNERMIL